MVRMAAGLARAAQAELLIVYVIVVLRSLPLDTEIEEEVLAGEAALDRAERVAEAAGLPPERFSSELLQARGVGPAIVDEAINRQVDLIVMGVTYRRRFGQFYLGQTAPYVLEKAPCRILLSREAQVPTSSGLAEATPRRGNSRHGTS